MSSCARLSLSVRRAFRIMMKIPWFYSELNVRCGKVGLVMMPPPN